MNAWWKWGRETEEVDTAHEEDEEAKAAFAKAMEDRQRAERTAAEVEPVMDKLKERREVNHYTELFEQVLRGGKK
jgi:hypothetical protein